MPWPWPRDSREDRAKRVALSYRHLIEDIARGAVADPGAALETLDNRWCDLGAGWVRPTLVPLNTDDWLTEAEAAELFHQAPKTVYAWGRRGQIRVGHAADGARIYNVGDIVSYQSRRRLRGNGGTCTNMRAGQTLP